jgi:hypothetical protein
MTSAVEIAVAQASFSVPVGTIPPVTRFVQETEKSALLGVRCGSSWCDVGAASGGVPISILESRGDIPAALQKTPQVTVKGWFDEQHIAVDAAGHTPPLTYDIGAAVVPLPGLRHISLDKYASGYQDVGYVYMPKTLPKYQERWGFKQGWNKISIKGSGDSWSAVITDPDKREHTRTVYYTPHTLGSLPGTARWDWMDGDEYIWISCDVGCCLIDNGRDS